MVMVTIIVTMRNRTKQIKQIMGVLGSPSLPNLFFTVFRVFRSLPWLFSIKSRLANPSLNTILIDSTLGRSPCQWVEEATRPEMGANVLSRW